MIRHINILLLIIFTLPICCVGNNFNNEKQDPGLQKEIVKQSNIEGHFSLNYFIDEIEEEEEEEEDFSIISKLYIPSNFNWKNSSYFYLNNPIKTSRNFNRTLILLDLFHSKVRLND